MSSIIQDMNMVTLTEKSLDEQLLNSSVEGIN